MSGRAGSGSGRDEERPCFGLSIGDLIDEFYGEYGSQTGEQDTIDVSEITTALAKIIAETTYASDAGLRQQIMDDLKQEILKHRRRVSRAGGRRSAEHRHASLDELSVRVALFRALLPGLTR